MLVEAETRLRRQGVALWMAALNPEVLTVVQQSPLGRTLGRERMFFNVQTAVQHYEAIAAAAQAGAAADPSRTPPGSAKPLDR